MNDDPLAPMRRFARPSAAAKLEADPFLCRHLRSKAFAAPESGPRASPSAAAPFWCLRTMREEGPDGSRAAPEECTDDRICFEASVGREGDS